MILNPKVLLLLIFFIALKTSGQSEAEFLLKGKITDKTTKEKITNTEIFIYGTDSLSIEVYPDSLGYYEKRLSPETGYIVEVFAPEYQTISEMIFAPDSGNIARQDFEMQPLESCSELKNISPEFLSGYYHYELKNYDSAAIFLSKYTREKPLDSLYPEGLMLLAESYFKMEDFDKAEKYLKEVYQLNKDKYDKLFHDSLTTQKYNNLNYSSAIYLAEIYMEREDYSTAKSWLDSSQHHPFSHFCGNASSSKSKSLMLLYASCFSKLGDIDTAIHLLTPSILQNSLSQPSKESIELLISLLEEKYGIEETKKTILSNPDNVQLKIYEEFEEELVVSGTITIFEHEFHFNGARFIRIDKYDEMKSQLQEHFYESNYKNHPLFKYANEKYN